MLIKKVRALFRPNMYHGWGRSNSYFEGWYFKLLSADTQHAYALIPGVAMDENGKKHAFIQVLDGKAQSAEYIRFPYEDFHPSSSTFNTSIAGNRFRARKLSLHLPQLNGELELLDTVPWPSSWYSPGIMGPYSFVPFMQCYHGIVSMNHRLKGQLTVYDKTIDFTGGRGYTEKDWGHSFPSAYFWMQSNHFSREGTSFKASVANIPWLRSSFVGFIAGLYHQQKLIQFTTYNGTRLLHSFADSKKVELCMENRKHRLEILAHRTDATELASPIAGFMDGRISESMCSEIDLQLLDTKSKKVLFEDTGQNAALEVAGKIEEIMC